MIYFIWRSSTQQWIAGIECTYRDVHYDVRWASKSKFKSTIQVVLHHPVLFVCATLEWVRRDFND